MRNTPTEPCPSSGRPSRGHTPEPTEWRAILRFWMIYPPMLVFGWIWWHAGFAVYCTRRAIDFGIYGSWRALDFMRRLLLNTLTAMRSSYGLQGLPALAAAIGVFAVATALLGSSKDRLIGLYLQAGQQALNRQDFATALLCFERVTALDESSSGARFGQALCLEAQGHRSDAYVIMKLLAPADQPGYAQAHLWLARRLGERNERAPAIVGEVEAHLLRALRGLPDSLEGHSMLAHLYMSTNRLDQAETHLLQACLRQPELHGVLAGLYNARGNKLEARKHASRAVDHYRTKAEANLDDQVARLGWAQALVIMEDFSAAVQVLQKGLLVTAAPVFGNAIARVYAIWAKTLAGNPKADLSVRLRLLEEGLKYDTNEPTLLEPLHAISLATGPEADRARAEVKRQLAQGKGAAPLYFILGTDALTRGKQAEARVLLEQALRMAPQFAPVANNLAWAILQSDKPDLQRAMSLVESALARMPDQPHFRDTRGRIYMKMGKWKEALQELLAAQHGLPRKKELHEALAETYDHLGLKELAEEHRSLMGQRGEAGK